MNHTKLKQFAGRVIEDTARGKPTRLPNLTGESKHWRKYFYKFSQFQRRLIAGELTAHDRASIFALNGNKKLPFLSFSSLPIFDCPGRGECEKFCYSLKGWRNVHPFFRQLRNTLLVRHSWREIEREWGRVLRLPRFRRLPAIAFRLYVDGDFDSVETVEKWMGLLRKSPIIEAYGYSKSWEVLLSYGGEWPKNYTLNLSSGSRYAPESGIARAIKSLPPVRGQFLAVGKKGALAYNSPEYRAEAKRKASDMGLKRVFVCPGECGSCTPQGHFCGSNNEAPVVILTH